MLGNFQKYFNAGKALMLKSVLKAEWSRITLGGTSGKHEASGVQEEPEEGAEYFPFHNHLAGCGVGPRGW